MQTAFSVSVIQSFSLSVFQPQLPRFAIGTLKCKQLDPFLPEPVTERAVKANLVFQTFIVASCCCGTSPQSWPCKDVFSLTVGKHDCQACGGLPMQTA